jgi:hypothetical protein
VVIVIEIQDELIDRWGSIFISQPNYQTKNTAFYLPGFDYRVPEKADEATFRFRILTKEQVSQMAVKNFADVASRINKRKAASGDEPQEEPETEKNPEETEKAVENIEAQETVSQPEEKPEEQPKTE